MIDFYRKNERENALAVSLDVNITFIKTIPWKKRNEPRLIDYKHERF